MKVLVVMAVTLGFTWVRVVNRTYENRLKLGAKTRLDTQKILIALELLMVNRD
jgi:hypothetical protein